MRRENEEGRQDASGTKAGETPAFPLSKALTSWAFAMTPLAEALEKNPAGIVLTLPEWRKAEWENLRKGLKMRGERGSMSPLTIEQSGIMKGNGEYAKQQNQGSGGGQCRPEV